MLQLFYQYNYPKTAEMVINNHGQNFRANIKMYTFCVYANNIFGSAIQLLLKCNNTIGL